MNQPLLHLLTACAAAGLGWLAGSSSSDAPAPAPTPRISSDKAGPILRPAARSSWEAQIASVRHVPGAQAESAWIKWCFAIPDADVPAAIAKLNPYSDFHALRCLYARWARLDPAAAWASFRKSAIPDKVSHFYLHEDDERRERGLVQSSFGTSPRALIASRILASIASQDPAAARALATKLRTPGSEDAKDVPVSSYLHIEVDRLLATQDPAASDAAPPSHAAADAAALTDVSMRGEALEKAALNWLQSDPAAACAWLQQLSLRDLGAFELVNLEWGLNHATPADRTRTLFALLEARGVTAEEIQRAGSDGRTGFPMGNNDSVANAGKAVLAWAKQDAAAARNWLTALPGGNLQAMLAGTIAGELVRTDVNAGIALLNQTGGDQDLAVCALMRSWMEADARAALAWAAKIDDAALRDTSRSTAAQQIAATDPALALETARTLTDPALRSAIFKQVRQSLSWNPAALRELAAKFPGTEWSEGK